MSGFVDPSTITNLPQQHHTTASVTNHSASLISVVTSYWKFKTMTILSFSATTSKHISHQSHYSVTISVYRTSCSYPLLHTWKSLPSLCGMFKWVMASSALSSGHPPSLVFQCEPVSPQNLQRIQQWNPASRAHPPQMPSTHLRAQVEPFFFSRSHWLPLFSGSGEVFDCLPGITLTRPLMWWLTVTVLWSNLFDEVDMKIFKWKGTNPQWCNVNM